MLWFTYSGGFFYLAAPLAWWLFAGSLSLFGFGWLVVFLFRYVRRV